MKSLLLLPLLLLISQISFYSPKKLLEILQSRHGCSVTMQSYQLKDLKDDAITYSNRKRIELPPDDEEPQNEVAMLELEAEALAFELELLAA